MIGVAAFASSGAGARGAWITVLHDGHGPVTPAKLDGTVSLMPQAGHKNEIESLAIRIDAELI